MLAEEEDPEVLGQVSVDLSRLQSRLSVPGSDRIEGGDEEGLRRLVCQTRSQLSPRRRRFDPSDLKAQLYLELLDRLSELLKKKGRLQESAAVLAERGLTRDPRVVAALERIERGKPVVHGGEYWDHFGQLWTAEGRRFILAICAQHLVRRRLRIAKEQKVAVRNLVPDHSKGWLLQRGLAAAYLTKVPC